MLIFTPWRTTSALISAGGLECLAASVSCAISYIYMDRFLARRGTGPVVLSACQLAAAAVMLAVALAVSGAPAPHVTAQAAAAVAVLGIVGTGFAYVLNYQVIAGEGATAASAVIYLLPVVAIVLGVVVLGETVTAAIALVLAGVALTRRRARPTQPGPGAAAGTPENGRGLVTTGRQAGHDHLHARFFVRAQAGTVPVRSLCGAGKAAADRLDALHMHASPRGR